MTFAFNNTLGIGNAGNGGNAETPELTTEVTSEVTDVTEPAPDATVTQPENSESISEPEESESISEPEVSESVSEPEGANECNGHGSLNACGSTCICDAGWVGSDCSVDGTCSGHGTIEYGWGSYYCICNNGWTGDNCSTPCSGHGVLNGTTCVCDNGWIGEFCSKRVACLNNSDCNNGSETGDFYCNNPAKSTLTEGTCYLVDEVRTGTLELDNGVTYITTKTDLTWYAAQNYCKARSLNLISAETHCTATEWINVKNGNTAEGACPGWNGNGLGFYWTSTKKGASSVLVVSADKSSGFASYFIEGAYEPAICK
jgi:hypothetical protein